MSARTSTGTATTLIEGKDDLTFVIQPRHRFLAFILAIPAASVLFYRLLSLPAIDWARTDAANVDTLFSTLIWGTGVILTIIILVWALAGRESIRFTRRSIIVTHEIFGMGWRRVYDLDSVSGIHISPVPLGFHGRPQGVLGIAGGVITFDYRDQRVRCGASIDESEGESIINRVKERFGSMPALMAT